MASMKIILASASPRRNEILKRFNVPFKKVVADAFELNRLQEGMTMEDVAMHNARSKAKKAAGMLKSDENSLIIGADTIVAIESVILPKPKDRKDAAEILRVLSGKTHRVITGLAIMESETGTAHTGFEETKVTFRELSDEDVERYVSTGEADDKAGAYGIQGFGAFLVEKIDGDYPNVVGLPIMKLYRMLKIRGVDLFKIASESGPEAGMNVI